MRVVIVEAEIFELEFENIVNFRIYPHCGQRSGVACELQLHLLKVIIIYV